MSLRDFITAMPKVELHVHLQGSTRPETLFKLAQKNNIELPVKSLDDLREWYTFSDFDEFLKVYYVICNNLQAPDDFELLMREFLIGQAEQNIRYSEVTFTPHWNLPFVEQLDALNQARRWAEEELGVYAGIVIDIPRERPEEDGPLIADWAISGMGNGVVAFGLGGPEMGNPPHKFVEAFDRARAAGLPSVPHAGETKGPESIWGALTALKADRIGHGVRCLEDEGLVDFLRDEQIPLEVCPTSNICLKVFPSFAEHPLPKLIDEGLYVTINSDDPPMFNTTLTDEYIKSAETFGFNTNEIIQLVLNALRASFMPDELKKQMEADFDAEIGQLRNGVE